MKLQVLDPLKLPDWDSLVLMQPKATIFHTSSWARVLHESYGYNPVYFASIENGGLQDLLPCMDVRSAFTGRRGISLPFTDYCRPIFSTGTDPHIIFCALVEHGRKAGWRYIELRSFEAPAVGATPSTTFYRHMLDLRRGEQSIRLGLRGSTWRNIKKAENAGVRVSMEASRDALREFYRLNCLTRQLHGLPPQPMVFFEKLYEHLLSKGLGTIALASYRGEVIAGAVYLSISDQLVYKYGASDRQHQHLRANNLVMWEAILWAIGKGFTTLCLGRTETGHEGLLQFKRGWGTVEETLHYYRYNMSRLAFVQEMPKTSGFHNTVFRAMPAPVLRLAGELLYPHIA